MMLSRRGTMVGRSIDGSGRLAMVLAAGWTTP